MKTPSYKGIVAAGALSLVAACTTGDPVKDCPTYVGNGVKNEVSGMTEAVANALSLACVSHSAGQNFNFGTIPAGIQVNSDCQTTIHNAYHLLEINQPTLESQAIMYCSGHANAAIAEQARINARNNNQTVPVSPVTNNPTQPNVVTIDGSELLADCQNIVADPLINEFTSDGVRLSNQNLDYIRNIEHACINLATTNTPGLPVESPDSYFTECLDVRDNLARVLRRQDIPLNSTTITGMNRIVDFCNKRLASIDDQRSLIWNSDQPWYDWTAGQGTVADDLYQWTVRLVD